MAGHERVREAMAAMPREWFLPAAVRDRAAYDGPLEIGEGQTNSQPRTVAAMVELLDVAPGQSVLDVGSGSAWSTALLAHLVGPRGRVVGVELTPSLAAWGAENLGRTDQPWARIEVPDPQILGLPRLAPFDRILVSAMADVLPEELVQQLRTGGVLVVPVAGEMLRVVRRSRPMRHRVSRHGRYRFVPLR